MSPPTFFCHAADCIVAQIVTLFSLWSTLVVCAEEQRSPELYANNVRELMGKSLGAELSSHGIKDQQALKANGIYVDWTGRCMLSTLHA